MTLNTASLGPNDPDDPFRIYSLTIYFLMIPFFAERGTLGIWAVPACRGLAADGKISAWCAVPAT